MTNDCLRHQRSGGGRRTVEGGTDDAAHAAARTAHRVLRTSTLRSKVGSRLRAFATLISSTRQHRSASSSISSLCSCVSASAISCVSDDGVCSFASRHLLTEYTTYSWFYGYNNFMALNSLLCADVPLRNCSINQPQQTYSALPLHTVQTERSQHSKRSYVSWKSVF